MEPYDFDRQDGFGRGDLLVLPIVGIALTLFVWVAQVLTPFLVLLNSVGRTLRAARHPHERTE